MTEGIHPAQTRVLCRSCGPNLASKTTYRKTCRIGRDALRRLLEPRILKRSNLKKTVHCASSVTSLASKVSLPLFCSASVKRRWSRGTSSQTNRKEDQLETWSSTSLTAKQQPRMETPLATHITTSISPIRCRTCTLRLLSKHMLELSSTLSSLSRSMHKSTMPPKQERAVNHHTTT